MRTLRAQLRYQKKALDTRINITVGIELKDLSSKVMIVHFSKTVGGSSAASSTANYRQLSGKLSSVVYVDPETARDYVVWGRGLHFSTFYYYNNCSGISLFRTL